MITSVFAYFPIIPKIPPEGRNKNQKMSNAPEMNAPARSVYLNERIQALAVSRRDVAARSTKSVATVSATPMARQIYTFCTNPAMT